MVNPQASLSIKGETFMYQLLVSPTAVGAVFQVLPITIFAGLIYILIHILTQRKGTEHTGLYFTIVNGLLVCYVVALVSLLLSPRNFWVYIWFYVLMVIQVVLQAHSYSPILILYPTLFNVSWETWN